MSAYSCEKHWHISRDVAIACLGERPAVKALGVRVVSASPTDADIKRVALALWRADSPSDVDEELWPAERGAYEILAKAAWDAVVGKPS